MLRYQIYGNLDVTSSMPTVQHHVTPITYTGLYDIWNSLSNHVVSAQNVNIKQELIRIEMRYSERELFYDDIAHILQNTEKKTYFV